MKTIQFMGLTPYISSIPLGFQHSYAKLSSKETQSQKWI